MAKCIRCSARINEQKDYCPDYVYEGIWMQEAITRSCFPSFISMGGDSPTGRYLTLHHAHPQMDLIEMFRLAYGHRINIC